MTKSQVNVSIDSDIASKAREQFYGDVSNICERALRDALGQSINEVKEERKCFRCKQSNDNMIWDGYSECWICPKCNSGQINSVSICAKI